jgi:N-acetylglutamate synthase-like GNAT family acetyltransferase
VFCVHKDDATAQLRILLITIAGRGQGLGRRLIDECIDFARTAGYRRMVLWTNDTLAAARHLYLAAGFTLVDESPHTASVSTSSVRTTNSTWPRTARTASARRLAGPPVGWP